MRFEPIRRRVVRWVGPVLPPLGGLAVALAAGALALWALGIPPLGAARAAISQGLGTGWGLGNVLRETVQLLFPALAVAFGFQAGLFNIGGEGQLYAASFCVASLALALEGRPAWLALPALFLCAAGAGAAWAAIPGLLKAWRGAHEVISTIMLNFIAFAGVKIFMRPDSPLLEPGTAQTRAVPDNFRLPSAESLGLEAFAHTRLNAAMFLALLALAWYWWFVWRTRAGLRFRAVGANPKAAEAAGISAGRHIVAAMAISGALAGLTALDEVLGQRGAFGEDSAKGLGFTAIAVALLGRGHPLGILAAAFFFGFLNYSGVVWKMGFDAGGGRRAQAPTEIVDIVQALVILFVATAPYAAEACGRWAARLWPREGRGS